MVMMMMNHDDIDNDKKRGYGRNVQLYLVNYASFNLPNNNALRLKILPHKKCMDYPYETLI